jgi:hypothetical protein
MKKPLLIMTALFLATTGAMAGDPYIALEKEYRNAVPHPRQKVPKAKALVIRANSLLKGDPTCEQMRQASKLLNKAVDMYVQANVFSGAQRVGGAASNWQRCERPGSRGLRGRESAGRVRVNAALFSYWAVTRD